MVKLLSLVLVLVLLAAGLAVSAQNCGPQFGLNAKKCAARIRKCGASGITLKFVGRGCRIGGIFMRDGGCQCDGYCGYLCKERCNKDRQCNWNATVGGCVNKLTGEIGGPIGNCSVSNATIPTSSPMVTPTASPVIATAAPMIAPTTSPIISTPSPICFHRDSIARLETGAEVTLTEIKFGDRVAAFDPMTHETVFSEVVGFNGYFPETLGEAVRIDLENGHLILSHGHVLYASLDGIAEPDFHMAKLLTTKSLVYGENLMPKRVTGISQVTARGWITPLTKTGTIIVNGMAASCHTRAHYAARAMYTPLYWYLSMFPHAKGSKPDAISNNEHWYAIGVRRSVIGNFIADIVSSAA